MSAPRYFVGLMSGTSLDGIDAALADFGAGNGVLLRTAYRPYPPALRERALALNSAQPDELHLAAVTANDLAHEYAAAVGELLAAAGVAANAVSAIGCHGQTIRHRPDAGYSIQLVNAALLAERSGICVVCDFRSRDIAAGGQGAPLAPAFHDAVLRSPDAHRVVVNLGGIANVTDLMPGRPAHGFDVGPGNLLMDAWAQQHLGAPYDANGAWARGGAPIPALLQQCLREPFFAAAPPKSTGRELFNPAWLASMLRPAYSARDVQATLAELTASAIAQAIERDCGGAEEVLLCGGGAHNAHLASRIGALLPGARIAPTDALGVPADWVEAYAFAWLARQAIDRQPGNIAQVTGARGARVLGAIYPA